MIRLTTFLNTYIKNNRIHTKSLVSTIFGDVLVPNDGHTWVKTLSELLGPIGINDRLVRTTLFRLVEDNWVYTTKSGRRSFYALTDSALSKTLLAEKLIYTKIISEWDGQWTLVFLVKSGIPAELKTEFIQELRWIGFGTVASNVLAYPGDIVDLVSERSLKMHLGKQVIVMKCTNIFDAKIGFHNDDRELAKSIMSYSTLEQKYHEFVNNFGSLLNSSGKVSFEGSAKELLLLRILMIDEYRRIILKDNHLPVDLLPDPWSGTEAYKICSRVYRHIEKTSTNYYRSLQNEDPIIAESGTQGINNEKLPKVSERFKI